jgi:SAM-dependent methyltransferase
MANEAMIELWNGTAGESWSSRADRYDTMLKGLGERALHAAALTPGDRVLDVGCGSGQLALQAAETVGPDGTVLGVDIAARLVALATKRASERGLSQAKFVEADAAVQPLGDSAFDAVISRFGVMFFDDPVAAFANLFAATRPGGRLAFVAWQGAPHNEWVTLPLSAVMPHTGAPPLPPPGAPGPFAFGDSDHVRDILRKAGWVDVDVEDVQTSVSVGGAQTAQEAADFTSGDIFGRLLLDKAEPDVRAAALADLVAGYDKRCGPDGVMVDAAAWLVTARRQD